MIWPQAPAAPFCWSNDLVRLVREFARFRVSSELEQLGRLVCVRALSLTGCGLCLVPEYLGEMAWLEELHLAQNQLRELPASVGRLQPGDPAIPTIFLED